MLNLTSNPIRQPISRLITAVLLIAAICGFSAAAHAEATVKIEGAATKPMELTAAQIKDRFAAEIHPVQYTSHGESHSANCVPLLSLLKAAGVPVDFKMDPKADPKTKNLPLRYVIAVQGRDGYVAAFSLAELMPDVGKREAWVVLEVDGKPLAEQDGPVKLLVPGDQKPSRAVHAVEKIRVIDVTAIPTS